MTLGHLIAFCVRAIGPKNLSSIFSEQRCSKLKAIKLPQCVFSIIEFDDDWAFFTLRSAFAHVS